MRMGFGYLDCEEINLDFNSLTYKKKTQNWVCYLDRLSNVLGFLHALLDLIKKKIYKEYGINIPVL